eukprot:TRINITY_DN972_c0_g1_i2.p1 TRINITY_DN972_c0_g1~~TRINITY_DN972_c0_g1_i2.p1  ORF type:complete len:264 (-),score=77.58 TRINITY_DN972_c0_g1_i2:70-861(-)
MSESIGMMNDAYFVSRGELLAWVNGLLGLNYSKVEQAASAAAYCQIMDAVYTGQVPLSKVNFDAKHEYEFVANYKVLQSIFDKFSIDRHVPVDKLIKAKYQDNLEFLQWMKRFYDTHAGGAAYNAAERRKQAGGKAAKSSAKIPSVASLAAAAPKAAQAPAPVATAAKPLQPVENRQSAQRVPVATKKFLGGDSDSTEKIRELATQNAELKLQIDTIEKERDFYFNKLRDVEIACQSTQEYPDFVGKIEKILYASDDAAAETF